MSRDTRGGRGSGSSRGVRELGDHGTRPSDRRGASGAWSRLKPMTIDPLEQYGLPSKGETRLHEHAVQEAYYSLVVERYVKLCAASPDGAQLEQAFQSLSVNEAQHRALTEQQSHSQQRRAIETRPGDLANIQMAMRKLREGILGSRRRDVFAQRVYVFIVHASILTRQWESYQPALLHLLHGIHPHTPLSAREFQEFTGYLILDLACRQHDLMGAIAVRHETQHKVRRTSAVLNSMIHDDWRKFWRLKRSVDGYQRALMSFADKRVRIHALKCIGRSYLSADRAYLEQCTDQGWEDIVQDGCGWQLQDTGSVTIRKPKSK